LPELIALPFTITNHGFAPALAYCKSSTQKLRFDVSRVALSADNYNSSEWENGNRFTNNNTGTYNIPTASFTDGSGKYYLNYLVLKNIDTQPANLTDSHVLSYGSIPVCFLTSSTVKTDFSGGSASLTVSSNEEDYPGDNGGPTMLYDGDISTHWHSRWNGGTHVYDATYGVYIDITLPETSPVNNVFQFKYVVRQGNSNARPTKIIYGYSNDGANWTRIGGITATSAMQNAAAGSTVELPGVAVPETTKFIRFGIAEAGGESLTGGSNSTNLAELELYYN
jgi:hypothetical protein